MTYKCYEGGYLAGVLGAPLRKPDSWDLQADSIFL